MRNLPLEFVCSTVRRVRGVGGPRRPSRFAPLRNLPGYVREFQSGANDCPKAMGPDRWGREGGPSARPVGHRGFVVGLLFRAPCSIHLDCQSMRRVHDVRAYFLQLGLRLEEPFQGHFCTEGNVAICADRDREDLHLWVVAPPALIAVLITCANFA